MGKHIVLARRSGDRWWLAAINGPDAATLTLRLTPVIALGLYKPFHRMIPA